MDVPQEDLKWFGEGFDGFPKRLPDDTVEYAIYIIDAKLAEAQIRSRLNSIIQTANDLTRKLLNDYIWQRDLFSLNLKREENAWLLHGRTNYGDSVADEWLVVFLLRELSKKYLDAWIRVYDSDGEFLLIEAANTLPKWLNPEIAENRVWINQGHLRILPLERGTTSSRNVTTKQALAAISSNDSNLIHSPLIEEEAFYRIRNYPDSIKESLHHSQISIPRRLAYVLRQNPSYVSPAIEAFYLRDPISLRPLHATDASALLLPPTDFVTTSVRFNKVGFAQLKSQEYPTPETWRDSMPKETPVQSDVQLVMGMKLTCGFEMMLSDPQNKDKKAVREIQLLLEDLDTGEETLPTDTEISKWDQKIDSDSWLDINFEDFEKELTGKPANSGPESSGFGDKAAQENLRKMVERFESFMNDEDAGAEGAEMDEMDFDDEDEDEPEYSSDEEDKDVSFNEAEFAKMMREMMGMPPDDFQNPGTSTRALSDEVEEIDGSDSDEGEEIRKLSQRMEAELNDFGALNLDPTPRKIAATRTNKGKGKEVESVVEDDSEGEELDIDFNLAKNMLESFKGQSGMAGPAGNLMSLLDVRFPRDESDEKAAKRK